MSSVATISKLQAQVAEADARGSNWLADGNAAAERGAKARAEVCYSKGQYWLDRSNTLRERLYCIQARPASQRTEARPSAVPSLVAPIRLLVERRLAEHATVGEHASYAATDALQSRIEAAARALEAVLRAADRMPGNNPLEGLADEAKAALALLIDTEISARH